MNQNTEEMLLDLLIKQASYGLSDAEQKQLDELEATYAEKNDLSFEITAAAIAQAGLGAVEPMPAHLRAKIEDAADEYFDSRDARPATVVRVGETTPKISVWNWLGWAVAAAACIALAANVWYTSSSRQVAGGQTPTPTPSESLTPSQMRQRLIDTAPDLAKATVGAGSVKELTPSGDVVWSDAKQAGYIRISGLPKNDTAKETYQLWVFEENQGDKTPIDGGIFDINSDGEVIIPINAKLKAKNPKMFAVTVEKPGGVVVSERKKIAALGKVET